MTSEILLTLIGTLLLVTLVTLVATMAVVPTLLDLDAGNPRS